MKKPFFSIIIANYNNELYLDKAIKSVLNQSFSDFELIIIDDGSTDNSRKVIRKYKKNDCIKIIFKGNSGVSDTRNIGINNSNGYWISFLDSDDWLDIDALYNTYSLIKQNHNLQLVVSNLQLISNDNKFIENKLYDNMMTGLLKNEERYELLNSIVSINYYGVKKNNGKYGNCRCIGGKFYKSDIIKKNNIYFPTNIKMFEDGIFNLYYLMSIKYAYFTSKKDYYYRQVYSSTTHTKNIDSNSQVTTIILELEKFYNKYEIMNKVPLIYSVSDLIYYSISKIAEQNNITKMNTCVKQIKYLNDNFKNYIIEFCNLNKYVSFKSKILFFLFKYKMYYLIYLALKLR